MNNKHKILAVIPARGGSKGLPDKNIKPLMGRPLISYALDSVHKVQGIQRTIVSTDSEQYAAIAREWGGETPFLRPSGLANSKITLIHVLAHALKYYDDLGEHFDAVLCVTATSPLTGSEVLQKMVDRYRESNLESVATVAKMSQHPYMAKRLVGANADRIENYFEVPKGVQLYPRQKREDCYYTTGNAFLRSRRLVENPDPYTNSLGNNPGAVVVDRAQAVNIDNLLDFFLAEKLMQEAQRTKNAQ